MHSTFRVERSGSNEAAGAAPSATTPREDRQLHAVGSRWLPMGSRRNWGHPTPASHVLL